MREANKMKNVLRTLVFDGQVSLTLADTTEIVQTAKKLHKLSPISTLVLGKALSAMTFASACLKEEKGEISLSVQCNGGCGGLGISGNRALRLRGYIENTQLSSEQEAFLQGGSLTIIRDDGYNRPFVGSCALPSSGGVDEAFEEYYRISEQLPTLLRTVVELNAKDECAFAGVAVLQPLPFASEETLEKMKNVSLQALLEEVKSAGVENVARSHFSPDVSVWDLREAIYRCNCSKDYLARVLVPLGEKELRRIVLEDGAVKIHCHYCNSDYEFTGKDVDGIFRK